MTELKWRQDAIDVGSLILAAVLALTPWALGFSSDQTMAINAWASGCAIAAVAFLALTRFAEWEEWIGLALGVWVAVSPWVLGFADHHETATWTHVVIGLIVAALAAGTLWHIHQPPAAAGH